MLQARSPKGRPDCPLWKVPASVRQPMPRPGDKLTRPQILSATLVITLFLLFTSSPLTNRSIYPTKSFVNTTYHVSSNVSSIWRCCWLGTAPRPSTASRCLR
ncbi:hypothetical protein BJY01DRAFT_25276 [Aspergillus pseudoustus]|uniref:Uncharacterized protein n=1 Tax=Aspergillus pseudoustus TaxID=1810923 RepID=A0ABR4KRE0_9EURO